METVTEEEVEDVNNSTATLPNVAMEREGIGDRKASVTGNGNKSTENQCTEITEMAGADTNIDTKENPNEEKASKKEKPNYHALIQEAKDEIKDLSTENRVLQCRLIAVQKRRSTIGTKLFLEGAEAQYQIVLKQWMDAKADLDRTMDDYNNKIDTMQEIVKEKQQEAHALHQEFSTYKWQVARDARHTYSGRKLCSKLLDELEQKDLDADVEIERLRIEGRRLASQLKKILHSILMKDQLPGDLFAVDYEQLKIENESLNDKLLKKNKDLVELIRKTTHTVHVLSHSRERLEFVQKKIKADKSELEYLETQLNKARSELQCTKIACERLHSRRERIQAFAHEHGGGSCLL